MDKVSARMFFTNHILKCLCRVLKKDKLPTDINYWNNPEVLSLTINNIGGRFKYAINTEINLQRLKWFIDGINQKETDRHKKELEKALEAAALKEKKIFHEIGVETTINVVEESGIEIDLTAINAAITKTKSRQ